MTLNKAETYSYRKDAKILFMLLIKIFILVFPFAS